MGGSFSKRRKKKSLFFLLRKHTTPDNSILSNNIPIENTQNAENAKNAENATGKNKFVKTIKQNGCIISIQHDDISIQKVDCIVNPANAFLRHGGGIAGSLAKKAGQTFQQESLEFIQSHGPIKEGDAIYTSAGNLNAKYVIHAVGPKYKGGKLDEEKKLRNAIKNTFNLAEVLQIQSIAIPLISSGIFGYPNQEAAIIMFDEIEDFVNNKRSSINDIRLIANDIPTITALKDEFIKSFIL